MTAGKVRRREHPALRKREGSSETASEEGKVHPGRDPGEHRLGEGSPMREGEDTKLWTHFSTMEKDKL